MAGTTFQREFNQNTSSTAVAAGIATAAGTAAVLAAEATRSEGAHAFDQIPAGQHAAIIAGTSTYDAASDLNTLLAQDPGILWLPKGVIGVGSPVLHNSQGTRIVGTMPGYATPQLPGASTIKALTGFTGAAILDVGTVGDDVAIRSVGVECVELNGANADVHGMRVNKPYDGCVFKLIHAVQIGDASSAFYIAGTDVRIGQTCRFSQLFGLKKNATGAGPVYFIKRLQESVFDLCKGFGVNGSAPTHDIFAIEDCTGLTFTNPSAANTLGYGFNILARKVENWLVSIDNPTFEGVGKALNVSSVAFKLFGSGLTVTTLGGTVNQPANGSTATGTVLLSSAIGIYVSTLTGTFATGAIYDSIGTNLGTITSITPFLNRNVRCKNPRMIGQGTTTPATSPVNYADCADIDWLTTTTNEVLALGTSVTNSNINAIDASKVTGGGVSVVVRDYADVVTLRYSDLATNPYTLPASARGRRLLLIADQAETTAGFWRLVCAGSDTIGYNRTGYGTADTQLLLSGTRSAVELYAADATGWIIRNSRGTVYGNNRGLLSQHPLPMVVTTSVTLGSQHSGAEVRNTGSSGIVVMTLPAIAGPGTTCNIGMEVSIYRDSAAQALRLAPNAADQIQGASAVNKYLSVDTDAGFARIKALRPNFWALLGSGGTISYAP